VVVLLMLKQQGGDIMIGVVSSGLWTSAWLLPSFVCRSEVVRPCRGGGGTDKGPVGSVSGIGCAVLTRSVWLLERSAAAWEQVCHRRLLWFLMNPPLVALSARLGQQCLAQLQAGIWLVALCVCMACAGWHSKPLTLSACDTREGNWQGIPTTSKLAFNLLPCVYVLLQGSVCQTAILCLSGLITWLSKSSEASDNSLLGW
jgi:hypothetical protein